MKKQHTILFAALFLILISFNSCKKDSTQPAKTKTELLTTGNWKFKVATVNGADASGYLQACQKDNIYTFLAAGTGTADEGASKCNMADPQSNNFNWNFESSETIIHVSTTLIAGTTNDFTLISLTEAELIVSTPFTPLGGPSFIIVITFTH